MSKANRFAVQYTMGSSTYTMQQRFASVEEAKAGIASHRLALALAHVQWGPTLDLPSGQYARGIVPAVGVVFEIQIAE